MEIKDTVKRHSWKILLGIVILAAATVGIIYCVLTYLEYEQMAVVESYINEDAGDGNYRVYLDGVLKYSRDGIAYLSEQGEEIWNQPCQMSNPIVEVCGEVAAVADKDGSHILVFQKNGLKGEIQTTMPIEKISVSAQGIVATILKNGENPKVMCYDADGNVLVEHKTNFGNTGYPVDVALSQDGNVLLVSFLGTKGGSIESNVVYYNFKDGEEKESYQVASLKYVDAIIPTAAFVDKKLSILIADNALVMVEGLTEPKEVASIPLEKEIKRVVYNKEYIALILKNSGKTNYELRLYRTDGEMVLSTLFEGEYSNIEIADKQIIMYEGNKCVIYNQEGVCKYKGELEMNIVNMFPVSGFNKYMVISTSGFQEMKLVK